MDDKTKQWIIEMTKGFTNKGLLIEAGWQGIKIGLFEVYPPEVQEELRFAFFSGADHLFSSIMTILDSGDEPTDADMARMDAINHELEEFREILKRRLGR